MGERRFLPALELRDDSLGQLLAQLDTPLVERVDAPNRALGKDDVLVKGDEFPKGFGGEPPGENQVGRAVALEDPVGDEPIRCALGLDLLGCLAEGQRLGLGEDVCNENVVVTAERVKRLVERYEVAGNEPRSLMDHLVKRVLAVCS